MRKATAAEPDRTADLAKDGATCSTVSVQSGYRTPLPGETTGRYDPRQEPGAVVPLAGICGGGSGQPEFLLRRGNASEVFRCCRSNIGRMTLRLASLLGNLAIITCRASAFVKWCLLLFASRVCICWRRVSSSRFSVFDAVLGRVTFWHAGDDLYTLGIVGSVCLSRSSGFHEVSEGSVVRRWRTLAGGGCSLWLGMREFDGTLVLQTVCVAGWLGNGYCCADWSKLYSGGAFDAGFLPGVFWCWAPFCVLG